MTVHIDSSAPHIDSVENYSGPFDDWGPVTTMIDGSSQTSGIRLYSATDGRRAGIWNCTPGHFRCHVTSDEFCHFIKGRATYTHESGEVIEVSAGSALVFPAGWKGTCRVHEEVRKVYMVR